MAKRDKGRLTPFVPLLKGTMDTPAWRALSHGARALYVALKRQVPKGRNQAYLSYRKAAVELGSSPRKIREWFGELEHYNFTVLVARGCLGTDGKGKASTWRLTELGGTTRANGIFSPPTDDFKRWDGVKFKPARDQRTPGAYGCKKQKPASHVVHRPLPTGCTGPLPASCTGNSKPASDGVHIDRGAPATDGVHITRLTTRDTLSWAKGRLPKLAEVTIVSALAEARAAVSKAEQARREDDKQRDSH